MVAETPPGVLWRLAGVKIKEYGRQNAPDKRPLAIRFPKTQILTQHWYELLEIYPRTATIGRWITDQHGTLHMRPAVSLKKVGQGAVVYVGTYLTPEILTLTTAIATEMNELAPLWPAAPEGVHVTLRENDEKRLWFFINDTGKSVILRDIPTGTNAITGNPLTTMLSLKRHGAAVIKQEKTE